MGGKKKAKNGGQGVEPQSVFDTTRLVTARTLAQGDADPFKPAARARPYLGSVVLRLCAAGVLTAAAFAYATFPAVSDGWITPVESSVTMLTLGAAGLCAGSVIVGVLRRLSHGFRGWLVERVDVSAALCTAAGRLGEDAPFCYTESVHINRDETKGAS